MKNNLEPPPQRQLKGDSDRLPASLEDSLQALEADQAMRAGLGDDFVDWYCALKRVGEIAMLPQSDMKKEGDVEALEAEREMDGYFM